MQLGKGAIHFSSASELFSPAIVLSHSSHSPATNPFRSSAEGHFDRLKLLAIP